jgi:hypothetical protein
MLDRRDPTDREGLLWGGRAVARLGHVRGVSFGPNGEKESLS